jgi:methyl coenzyme M reductase gamma subunit
LDGRGERCEGSQHEPFSRYRWIRARQLSSFYGVPASRLSDAQTWIAIVRDLDAGTLSGEDVRRLFAPTLEAQAEQISIAAEVEAEVEAMKAKRA